MTSSIEPKAVDRVMEKPVETPVEEKVETPVETPVEAPSETPAKKPNKWMTHVQSFRAAHPDLSFKDCLKQAKETYVRNS